MSETKTIPALCQRALRFLRAAVGRELPRSALLRKLHVDSATLDTVVSTLTAQGDLEIDEYATRGRSAKVYKVLTRPEGDPRLESLGRLFETAIRMAMAEGKGQ